MKILFVGDIHGEFRRFSDLINLQEPDITIQLGDNAYFWLDDVAYGKINPGKSKVYLIPGNHENWNVLENVMGSRCGTTPIEIEKNIFLCPIGSSITVDDYKILFLGGADSIDKDRRIPDYSWFRQELFRESDYEFVKQNVKEADIICAHTCPNKFDVNAYIPIYDKLKDPSRVWFDMILDDLKPQAWFFGHWHEHMVGQHNETQWECLDHIRGSSKFFNVFEISEAK